jgi:hypothetical protein
VDLVHERFVNWFLIGYQFNTFILFFKSDLQNITFVISDKVISTVSYCIVRVTNSYFAGCKTVEIIVEIELYLPLAVFVDLLFEVGLRL